MKKEILLIFLTFFLSSYSQTNFEYIGALKLNGVKKTVITYRLTFTENKGVIKGFSITDFGGSHETKNLISGTYEKRTKTIRFKEDEILYTKSKFTKEAFCFVNFEGVVKLLDKSSKLEGAFKGLYNNKTKCIDGELTLIGSDKLYNLLGKINKQIQKSKKLTKAVKENVNAVKMLDSVKLNYLKKDENLTIFVKTDKIILEIWDNGTQDGDIVNLYHNNKILLRDFEVSTKKTLLNVTLSDSNNEFTIHAQNEGYQSPNTAMIRLIDTDERMYELTSNLKKSEKASITLIKK
jgi:hypothetical protein